MKHIFSGFLLLWFLAGCEAEKVSPCGDSSVCDAIVYPNPFANEITLEFKSDTEGTAKLSITSLSGEKLFEDQMNVTQGNNQFLRSYASLNTGIYILSIDYEDEVQNVRIVKK